MAEGTLYYKDGQIRFIGSYCEDESGSIIYKEGTLFRKDGKLWMEGVFQRGGLRKGKEYYPSGTLMFSGDYNDRDKGRYYGPPFPVDGVLYDAAGNVICEGPIPVRRSGSLGYPYIILPDGEELPVRGIAGNHSYNSNVRKGDFPPKEYGTLPSCEEFFRAVENRYWEYMKGQNRLEAERFLRCEETQKMIHEAYARESKAWNEKKTTEKKIMGGAVNSLTYCLYWMFE